MSLRRNQLRTKQYLNTGSPNGTLVLGIIEKVAKALVIKLNTSNVCYGLIIAPG